MVTAIAAVPVNALSRAVAAQREELHATAARVIDSGWFVLGPETEAFEQEFAASLGVGHCVGVGNGTDALEVALVAVGVSAASTVATVANAGMYATSAILKIGAKPLFVDVDAQDLLMTAASLRAAVEGHPGPVAAVVVTHLFGQLADVAPLLALCRSIGAALIEDCAQAAGARRDGRLAGSLATIGTYSFYPTKNLAALGDGGAVVTDDPGLADRVRRLRQYGWDRKYHAVTAGGRNTRLDEIQAAVLRLRLPQLAADNAVRRSIVARYAASVPAGRRFVLSALDESFSAHLAVLSTPARAADRAHLESAGVATDVHYPIPDHRQPALALSDPPSLPVTEAAAEQVLTLPCFPQLRDDEIERVCAALRTMP
ncbi:MAG: erythromycin biosynthesis sensory transduction protein eryC1 [Pseudonocardiales bacterium]|nr:MAG: erythromycin biosynthesis sensory transduction protein eryC1 [Pseudonocardiales bacterium]